MSDKPVFLYAALYDDIADAEADYEAVFDLHAAGAILTMLSQTMMPEAYEHGGKVVGVVTTLGFAVAFAIHTLD